MDFGKQLICHGLSTDPYFTRTIKVTNNKQRTQWFDCTCPPVSAGFHYENEYCNGDLMPFILCLTENSGQP